MDMQGMPPDLDRARPEDPAAELGLASSRLVSTGLPSWRSSNLQEAWPDDTSRDEGRPDAPNRDVARPDQASRDPPPPQNRDEVSRDEARPGEARPEESS